MIALLHRQILSTKAEWRADPARRALAPLPEPNPWPAPIPIPISYGPAPEPLPPLRLIDLRHPRL